MSPPSPHTVQTLHQIAPGIIGKLLIGGIRVVDACKIGKGKGYLLVIIRVSKGLILVGIGIGEGIAPGIGEGCQLAALGVVGKADVITHPVSDRA